VFARRSRTLAKFVGLAEVDSDSSHGCIPDKDLNSAMVLAVLAWRAGVGLCSATLSSRRLHC
jgi:hypothetical protein